MRSKALLTVLIMLMVPMLTMAATAQSGEFDISKFSDKAVDGDEDGKYDHLELYGVLEVDSDERYTVRAAISPAGNKEIEPFVVEERFEFGIGYSDFKLRFPGHYFWQMKHTGNYMVHVQLFDKDEYYMTSADYKTGTIDYRKFEEPGSMVELIKETADDMPMDLDDDGLYDLLEISVEAKSNMEGPVLFYAEMQGSQVCNKFELEKGIIPLQFIFDGSIIVEGGRNGSYPVEIGKGCEREPTVLMEFQTREYNYTDFGSSIPLAEFDGGLKAKAVDVDGNGKYEFLRLTAMVNVSYSMTYTLVGSLFTQDIPRPIQVSSSMVYDAGRFEVSIDIPGNEMVNIGVDGPYSVSLALYSMSLEEPIDRIQTRIVDLKAEDFEGGSPPIVFNKKWTDQGVDTNDNGLYDYLEIIIYLEVKEPGEYQVSAHLGLRGFWFSDVFFPQDLGQGEEKLSFRFRGQDIYEHGADGQFTVSVQIHCVDKSKDPDMRPEKPLQISVWTKEYKYKDFEHKEPVDDTDGPIIIDDDKERITETPVMKVTLQKTKPSIMFTYVAEDAKPVEFHLVYERLMVFKDPNSNGQYDEGEETHEARLASDDWDMSSIKRESIEGGGSKASFTMSTILDLTVFSVSDDKDEFISDWARVSFTFTVSSRTESYVSPIAFTLDGNSELKIDIGIAFRQKVDGDGLVLEHHLFDRDHIYKFKTHEADGDHIWNGVASAGGEVFDQISDKEQMISFLSSAGKEHGFYSWVPKVEVTTDDGVSEFKETKATYYSEAQGLKLYMLYPFSSDVSSIDHDPSVGLDPENIPTVHVDITTDFNPSFYIVALVLAGVVVIVVWRRGEDE